MTDKIEPALSAEEWILRRAGKFSDAVMAETAGDGVAFIDHQQLAVTYDNGHPLHIYQSQIAPMIALANAALPDSDPRKITRAWVVDERAAYVNAVYLARIAQDAGDETERRRLVEEAKRHSERADALESYLPPEPA